MSTRSVAAAVACLMSYICLLIAPAQALEAIPIYESVAIGATLRDLYPTAGVSSPSALNEQGPTVGRVVIDGQY